MWNPDEAPNIQDLPDEGKMPWRHHLIKRLARGDAILMNVELVSPRGFSCRRRTLEAKSVVVDCMFIAGNACVHHVPIPGTEIFTTFPQ